MNGTVVAQISNLPYRGFPIRWSWPNSRGCSEVSRPAEWNSAIQQIGNLRYRLAPVHGQ
jgi:hypothetical protein